MNRGVEIAADVADLPRSVVIDQVRNGVAVRMAVLFDLLGSGRDLGRQPDRKGSDEVDRHPRAARSSTPPAPGGPTCWSRTACIARRGRRRLDLRGRRRRSTPAGAWSRPGLVDLHTHLRQPGKEEAETVETGARAAALGGFTCVLAMPNTTPAIDSAGVAREVLDLGRGACVRGAHVGGDHGRPGGARSSRPWPSWPSSACGSSPTTAAACRTPG